MKNEEQIGKALNLLREADAGAQAPEFMETRLRAAFRENHAVKPWWQAWRLWAGIAMAGLITCAVVYRVAPVPIAAKVPSAPAPVPQPVVAASETPAKAKAPRPTPRRRTEPVPAVTASTTEAEEFYAIPYAPPITAQDRGEVIRVRLPRQSLRSMGFPVNPERLFERVPADVLVGEDGIPRGIRLIRTSEGR
ncbi:MAG: hypothetical protein SGI92_29795 [Bryobacteraceae bacterium]|nr:hypothetical protein [Bryobacteraceae bacterium]